MPHVGRSLTPQVLRDLCVESFGTSGCDRYGIEAEWPTPRLGRITFEPGGQVEVSTMPQPTIGAALAALAEDAAFVRAELTAAGVSKAGVVSTKRSTSSGRYSRKPRA